MAASSAAPRATRSCTTGRKPCADAQPSVVLPNYSVQTNSGQTKAHSHSKIRCMDSKREREKNGRKKERHKKKEFLKHNKKSKEEEEKERKKKKK